jgi:hypothetical protein
MGSPLHVVIPAAGLGRRMKSFGPKALIPVGPETVLARQIRLLREAFPKARFVVVGGYAVDRLRKSLPAGVKMVVNPNFETTNVAYSLYLGLRHTPANAPALLVYGDLVFRAGALAGLSHKRSAVLVDAGPGREQEVGLTVVDGLATRFDYGLPAKWAQVAMLALPEKAMFLRAAAGLLRAKHFGYEILNEVLDLGGEFAALTVPPGTLVEIDAAPDVDRAKSLVAS